MITAFENPKTITIFPANPAFKEIKDYLTNNLDPNMKYLSIAKFEVEYRFAEYIEWYVRNELNDYVNDEKQVNYKKLDAKRFREGSYELLEILKNNFPELYRES